MSLKAIIPAIIQNFLEERPQWFLWMPVLLAIGIGMYFLLPTEPPAWLGSFSLLLLTTASYAIRKRPYMLFFGLICLIITAGFTLAQWRSIRLDTPTLSKKTSALTINGTLAEMHLQAHGARIIMTDLTLSDLAIPLQKIRLTVRTDMNHASIGDIITLRAVLRPPPLPVYPGGYDFSRIAYFQGIGAVGYAISPIEIIQKAYDTSWMESIATFRKDFALNNIGILGTDTGSIAAALLVGERGKIPDPILENVRHAGLAHLLAISGMHLALVAAVFFFLTRSLLASSEMLCLHLHIKKWAAFVAIIGSFGYLLVSGMPISAQRAFIMTFLVLIAIMIDRTVTPLRLVAWAALIVLIVAPESLLTPSFQMSFAAVTALIAVFQHYSTSHQLREHTRIWRHIYRPFYYLLGIILSSFIAGMATAPYGIYHFNQYSSYGILANLVAIPLASFWVMPWGALALVLSGFGLESVALIPMGWGINGILAAAAFVAHLPLSTTLIPAMHTLSLILITLGGCWILLWQRAWRFWGVPIMLIGALYTFWHNPPDMIIDQEGTLFAVKDQEDQLAFSSLRHARYARAMWLNRAGQETPKTLENTQHPSHQCDDWGCIYRNHDQSIAITRHPLALKEDCLHNQLVVNLANAVRCKTIPTITRKDLYYKGTHILHIMSDGNILTQHVRAAQGNRLWSH